MFCLKEIDNYLLAKNRYQMIICSILILRSIISASEKLLSLVCVKPMEITDFLKIS